MATTDQGPVEVSQPGEVRVRRALLTVSDKRGLVEFARGLAELGIEIVSTGGTARELDGAGVPVRSIDDYTGFPEMLDGRVKTLNPRIYAGLLAVRSNPEHVQTLTEHNVEPIDLVCVNLYPFERTAARRGVSDEEVIENIDIGGPTLIRAAAKNHQYAAVVVTPESYDAVLEELRMTDGRLSENTREALALDAFSYTARYDAAIARWFAEREDDFPALYPRVYEKALDLLTQKPNVRILEDQERRTEPVAEHDVRRVRGGLLVQDRDDDIELRDEMRVVTERAPTEREWGELLFAWKICKHVRSNAIVLAKNLATVGIGAGQMSRVDAVKLAIEKSTRSLDGAALASDAFFPFADGPQAAIDQGVRAIIQPGGSRRDEEVIEACNAANVAMVFTSR